HDQPPPIPTLFPYTTLFRSKLHSIGAHVIFQLDHFIALGFATYYLNLLLNIHLSFNMKPYPIKTFMEGPKVNHPFFIGFKCTDYTPRIAAVKKHFLAWHWIFTI